MLQQHCCTACLLKTLKRRHCDHQWISSLYMCSSSESLMHTYVASRWSNLIKYPDQWFCMYIGFLYACSGGLFRFCSSICIQYINTSWKRKSSEKRVSPLFCFHVLYWLQTEEQNQGRVGLLHLYFSNDRSSAVPSTVLWFSTHFQCIKKYLVAFLGDIAGLLTNMV